jgi:hypothetical protein
MALDFSTPTWIVRAPTSMRGQTNIVQGQPITGEKYEVHVDKSHEAWNVYRIIKTGQKLKIKLAVNEVNKFIDKFDLKGMPIYDVPNGVTVILSEPEPKKGQ